MSKQRSLTIVLILLVSIYLYTDRVAEEESISLVPQQEAEVIGMQNGPIQIAPLSNNSPIKNNISDQVETWHYLKYIYEEDIGERIIPEEVDYGYEDKRADNQIVIDIGEFLDPDAEPIVRLVYNQQPQDIGEFISMDEEEIDVSIDEYDDDSEQEVSNSKEDEPEFYAEGLEEDIPYQRVEDTGWPLDPDKNL